MLAKIKQLKNHQGFIKYFKNTSWLFFEKVLRMTVGLFVGVWVARYLGPNRFGLLSYAQSFVALFATFATLGLDGIVVRELVKDENNANVILGTAFGLKFLGSICVLIILYVAVNFTSNDSHTNLLIFIIASATIFQSFNVIDFYFQSKVLSRYVVYANTISLLFSSFAKIICIIVKAPLEAFVWLILFDSVILALGLIYFYIKNFRIPLKFNISKIIALSLLRDSWPLMLSGAMGAIYMKVDQVMLKEMLDDNAIGQYAAATRISELWYFIPVVICGSLFPAIINAKQISERLYYERLENLYSFMVILALSVSLLMTFFGDWVSLILYGEQFNEVGYILIIHIWSGVFVFLGVAAGKWVLNENLLANALLRTFIGACLNVVLNYIFIIQFGVIGAAYSTLITYAFVNYLSLGMFKKTRKCFYSQTKAFNILKIYNVR